MKTLGQAEKDPNQGKKKDRKRLRDIGPKQLAIASGGSDDNLVWGTGK